MKVLAYNQEVGDGQGFFHVRDLYEDNDGSRFAVHKTVSIDAAAHRKTPVEELLRLFPTETLTIVDL